jgi:uncharacterized protein with beta-barrel porin domain
MSKGLLPSEDLFPFPLGPIREGVDGRHRKPGVDAGDFNPSARVGASSLRRRERVFMVGAELRTVVHWRNPVPRAGVSRGEGRGDWDRGTGWLSSETDWRGGRGWVMGGGGWTGCWWNLGSLYQWQFLKLQRSLKVQTLHEVIQSSRIRS